MLSVEKIFRLPNFSPKVGRSNPPLALRWLLAFVLPLHLPLVSLAGIFEFRLASGDNTFNVIQEIDRRVEMSLGEGRVPVIVFDLDDTLFLNATRNTFYIREIARRDPRFLSLTRVHPREFVGKTWDRWTQTFLSQHVFSDERERSDLRLAFSTIKDLHRLDAISKDEVITVMAELVRRWSSRAVIVYLTAREAVYSEVTQEMLSTLPPGRVVHKDSSVEKSSVYKGRRLSEVVAEIPEAELVATFDDEERNLAAMKIAVPSAIHVIAKARVEGSVVSVFLNPFVVTPASALSQCSARASSE